jgi:5'-nucleotidase / UDP-sugar diphosphatase
MPHRLAQLGRLLTILAAVSVAIGVGGRAVGVNAAAPASFTILHFNDVYEIDAVEGGKEGGLARVATLIDRLKRRGPVLTTLGGDYLSPSAIGTAVVNGAPLAGRQMVDVLNAIGLQWATLGNHEFDVSEAAFHARMSEATFHTVVSNVTDTSGQPFAQTVRSAVVPIRANGRTLRVGLIGLVIDENAKPWVRYQDPVESARTQVALLRGRTDAIVALTHLSLVSDKRLVEAVPEIDLVLGGHEHENWLAQRGRSFTPIVKADANARSVAVVTLTFDRPGARPIVSSRLQVIDERIPPKVPVDALVHRWVSSAFDAFRASGFVPERTVATVPRPLDGREGTIRNGPGELTDLVLGGVVREAAPVDVGVFNAGSVRIDDVLPPGVLTEYDIIRILPFGGAVVKASLDGSLLAQVLDAGVANRGAGGFLHVSGATSTSSGWLVGGRPLDPAARYTVAMPDFLLTGAESRMAALNRSNVAVHDVQTLRDMRLGFIDELKARFP